MREMFKENKDAFVVEIEEERTSKRKSRSTET